jgi:hypothetical protein
MLNMLIGISALIIGLNTHAMQSPQENLWDCKNNICLLVYHIQAHNMIFLDATNIGTLKSLVPGGTNEEINSAWEKYAKCRILREGNTDNNDISDHIMTVIFYYFDFPTLELCLAVSLQWNRIVHQSYEKQIRDYLIEKQQVNPKKFSLYRPMEYLDMIEKSGKKCNELTKQWEKSMGEYKRLMAKRQAMNMTRGQLRALMQEIQTQSPIFENDINSHGTHLFISLLETAVLGDRGALFCIYDEIKTNYVDKKLPFSLRLFGIIINPHNLDSTLMKKFYEQMDYVIKRDPEIKIVKDFFKELYFDTEALEQA